MNQTVTKRKPTPVTRNPVASMFPRGFFTPGLFDDFLDHYLTRSNNELTPMNVSMDVSETDQAFEVKVDLPGIQAEDVDIQIENNTLTIRGQRKEEVEEKDEARQYHRVERYVGSFARSVVLPTTVNEDETAAEFRNGVLKVVIPKMVDAQPRKIKIAN